MQTYICTNCIKISKMWKEEKIAYDKLIKSLRAQITKLENNILDYQDYTVGSKEIDNA